MPLQSRGTRVSAVVTVLLRQQMHTIAPGARRSESRFFPQKTASSNTLHFTRQPEPLPLPPDTEETRSQDGYGVQLQRPDDGFRTPVVGQREHSILPALPGLAMPRTAHSGKTTYPRRINQMTSLLPCRHLPPGTTKKRRERELMSPGGVTQLIFKWLPAE